MKEYDIIQAKFDLSSFLLKGTRGTVLVVFSSIPVEYIVEFVDNDGKFLATLIVTEESIELCQ